MRELDNIRGNNILAALIAAGCDDLDSHLELVPMPVGKVVYESGGPMRYAYFPTTAIMSMLYIMNDGTSDEIATVGGEGFIGVQLFLGCETIPSRALVRSAGHAFRVVVEDSPRVCPIHRHVTVGREATENLGVADVHPAFEEQVP